MTDRRNTTEILENLKRIASERDFDDSEKTFEESFEAEDASKIRCLCDSVSKVYLSVTSAGRELRVCPACNPRRHCKQCNGTGHHTHFNLETLTNEVIPFGCVCTQLEKRLELFNRAGVPYKYLTAEFKACSFNALTPEQLNKMNENQDMIYNFCTHAHHVLENGLEPDDPFFLVLMGPVGTGKTHFGVAALRRLTFEFGHKGRFIDFQRLLQELKDSYAKQTSEEDILEPLRQVPILLIDEFGKGRAESEWQLEKLDDLVNSRYNAGKITIITTNYLTSELLEVWKKQLSPFEKRFISGRTKNQVLPKGMTEMDALLYDTANSSVAMGESFWTQSLAERIGIRMYDRICEVSVFVDFLNLPSFRRTPGIRGN